MMRMMRKMFKRIVSIVMALLVILGTAVYGGSVFAEGAPQEQADSASVTFSNDYIYLDPTGMDLNQNADWNNGKANVCIRFTDAGGGDPKGGTYENGFWKFKVSDFSTTYGDSRFYFTYIGGTKNDHDWGWDYIKDNKNPYYRTDESTITVNNAKGSVVVKNGTTTMNGLYVYTIAVKKSYAGNTLSFVDMTGTCSSSGNAVTAMFSPTDDFKNATTQTLSFDESVHSGNVIIPANENGDPYKYVKFITGTDTELAHSIKISSALSNGGTYYYGAIGTKDSDGSVINEGIWGQAKPSSSEDTPKILYMKKASFINFATIQIGDAEQKQLSGCADSTDSSVYSFDLSGVDSNTVFTMTDNNNKVYRFYLNGNNNLIINDYGVPRVSGIYKPQTDETYPVYYDATLSKMTYTGDGNNLGIPIKADGKIFFHASGTENDSNKSQEGELQVASSGSWKDVYVAELNDKYKNIFFYGVDNKVDSWNNNVVCSNRTVESPIPWQNGSSGYKSPCFYADSSDDCIYYNHNRSGYWNQVYTTRDAENSTNTMVNKSGNTIVNVNTDKFTRNYKTLYVNTTLYDYYTDYELNGNNRDNYDKNSTVATHRIYQPFRQFDQALSSYYSSKGATSPLYWGNFQNFEGSKFKDIAVNLSLYGYGKEGTDDYQKFFYENNSMWGRHGENLTIDNNLNGQNATQGLVSDTLMSGDSLAIKTSGGIAAAPYFDENFLSGNNSKNAVLGKVYHNVAFPFEKVKINSPAAGDGTVDYWYFNSSNKDNNDYVKENNKSVTNKNLRLKKDINSENYFLQPTDEVVKGKTTSGETDPANYFPFNDKDQSGNAGLLNYGFGQKFDIKFKLTSDGKVKDSRGNAVPIEFNFSGDDDVWVFIDGKLVLDVGGAHDVVTGKINFSDKTATVNRVKRNNKNDGGAAGVDTGKDGTGVVSSFPKEIADNNEYFTKEHTLTMFYMERGLWESNLKITFNFPDENELQVQKNVSVSEETKSLFPDIEKWFSNSQLFPFTIQNQATHYGTKDADTSESSKPLPFIASDNYNNADLFTKPAESGNNIFKYVSEYKGHSNVVHWKADRDDQNEEWTKYRVGIINAVSSRKASFDASNCNKYLRFGFYYDYGDNPSLTNIYIELEDSAGKKIGGFLTAGKAYTESSMTSKKWTTIYVDLAKLQKTTNIVDGDSTYTGEEFNYGAIKNIKFAYNFSRDIYLDDFTFIPYNQATVKTGFVTQQSDIPDYKSATSGKLEYPENARYTLSSDSSASSDINLIGSDGRFYLANGQTATFTDQFRRGSYISIKEDVDSNIFDTNWTLYENGNPVTTLGKGSTVNNTTNNTIPDEWKKRTTLKDGRQEVYNSANEIKNTGYTITGWAKKYDDKSKDDDNTIVFRSYAEPNNTTTATKLKVAYTNTLKTGQLTIKKEKATNSAALDGIYKIHVKFSNIAGMAIESGTQEKVYELSVNGTKGKPSTYTITGIPAGTSYQIWEETPTDGSSLDSYKATSGVDGDEYKPTVTTEDGITYINGVIKAGNTDSATVTFINTKEPKLSITVEKKWYTDANKNIKTPDSVKVRLQRKTASDTTWTDVKYPTESDEYVELTASSYDEESNWKYTFTGLQRYVNYSVDDDSKEAWQYRVVELQEGKDKNGNTTYTPIENGGVFNGWYKVDYKTDGTSDFITVQKPADGATEEALLNKNYTIENTYEKKNLEITKIDASDNKTLPGVDFKLEKKNKDVAATSSDAKWKEQEKATTDKNGLATFRNLEAGTYRLTETKAHTGYNLLKSPIIITIADDGSVKIDDKSDVATINGNTISFQVSNRKRFELPHTGGLGAMLFILCGMALATLCCLIFFLINLRKEVQYSRLKRQRRNAIGK